MNQRQYGADFLLVAAHAPDLSGMCPYLGERVDGVLRNLRVRSKIIGIGASSAAAAVTRGILSVQPRAVIMIGTCGVYPNLAQYRPQDVVIATRAHAIDHAHIMGGAAFPDPMQTVATTHSLMSTALSQCHARAHLAAVGSPLGYTTGDSFAASVYDKTGCETENLEIFGVALACRATEIPFIAALGVSHMVGSSGRQDHVLFHRDALNNAANTVATWIHNGAPGLPH